MQAERFDGNASLSEAGGTVADVSIGAEGRKAGGRERGGGPLVMAVLKCALPVKMSD